MAAEAKPVAVAAASGPAGSAGPPQPAPLEPEQLVDASGWFHERQVMWPGQCMSLKVKKVLCHTRSKFQDILVFESETYGRVLVLDGVIQLTERDEHAYQEMIAHLPMMSLRREPRRVLVVGGGDGGVVREVARYPGVEAIVQCEIDAEVIEVSKRFLAASTACAFDDPRLTVVHMDAAVYVRDHPREFDVIIVDSSDPVGPAETLFTSSFFASLRSALAPGGVVATQGECQWLHLPLIRETLEGAGGLFAQADYAYCTIPTYPSGQIGFILCTNDETPGMLRGPSRTIPAPVAASLRYYTPEIHAASFVLPRFAEAALADVRGKVTVRAAATRDTTVASEVSTSAAAAGRERASASARASAGTSGPAARAGRGPRTAGLAALVGLGLVAAYALGHARR